MPGTAATSAVPSPALLRCAAVCDHELFPVIRDPRSNTAALDSSAKGNGMSIGWTGWSAIWAVLFIGPPQNPSPCKQLADWSPAAEGTHLAPVRGMPRLDRHVVLLGDSIFDNAAYVGGGPDVITQLRAALPR